MTQNSTTDLGPGDGVSTDMSLAAGSPAEYETPGGTSDPGPENGAGGLRRLLGGRLGIIAAQAVVLGLTLAAWQWLPSIQWLSDQSKVFDRYFVSSPSLIAERLWNLLFSPELRGLTWEYIWLTVNASLVGLVIGMVSGGVLGLAVAANDWMSSVFHPFAVALNAIPRIALIPVIVVVLGPTFQASVMISVIVVFFIAFFNAFEGARTVSPNLTNNARIMGASGLQIMRRVRAPYAAAWTMASLPLAGTFSVIAVITGEILTGSGGLGSLIVRSTSTADATLTFAVVVLLSLIGVAVVGVAGQIKSRVLHWWGKS